METEVVLPCWPGGNVFKFLLRWAFKKNDVDSQVDPAQIDTAEIFWEVKGVILTALLIECKLVFKNMGLAPYAQYTSTCDKGPPYFF